MSHELWMEVMDGLDEESLELSKYFTHQLLHNPRHLLFTLSRYKAAAKMLPRYRDCAVLELGCNEGLGTLILAENATSVTGVDFDQAGIEWAQKNLKNDKLSFVSDDFLGKEYGTYDAVISLDVIEHISPDDEARFFATVMDNIAPGARHRHRGRVRSVRPRRHSRRGSLPEPGHCRPAAWSYCAHRRSRRAVL